MLQIRPVKFPKSQNPQNSIGATRGGWGAEKLVQRCTSSLSKGGVSGGREGGRREAPERFGDDFGCFLLVSGCF